MQLLSCKAGTFSGHCQGQRVRPLPSFDARRRCCFPYQSFLIGDKCQNSEVIYLQNSDQNFSISNCQGERVHCSFCTFICHVATLLFPLKFMFSKKATKIDDIFTVDLTLCSKRQIDSKDFINFCGLLRKYKLYQRL